MVQERTKTQSRADQPRVNSSNSSSRPAHLLVIAANEANELYNGLIATNTVGSSLFLRLAELLIADLAVQGTSHYGMNTRRLFLEIQCELAPHLHPQCFCHSDRNKEKDDNDPEDHVCVFEDYAQIGDVYFLREWKVSDDGWGRYVIKVDIDTPLLYGNGNRNWPPRDRIDIQLSF